MDGVVRECLNFTSPTWSPDVSCCTIEAPCPLFGGDCDSNFECEGDLICSPNSCNSLGLPVNFPFEEGTSDCCVDPLWTYVPQQMNWFAARDYCNTQNLTLTSVRTEEESQRLVDYMTAIATTLNVSETGSLNLAWLGGNDLDEEGSFVWSDGSGAIGPDFGWLPNEPNNNGDPIAGGVENCIEMQLSGPEAAAPGEIGWNDAECDRESPFICAGERDEAQVDAPSIAFVGRTPRAVPNDGGTVAMGVTNLDDSFLLRVHWGDTGSLDLTGTPFNLAIGLGNNGGDSSGGELLSSGARRRHRRTSLLQEATSFIEVFEGAESAGPDLGDATCDDLCTSNGVVLEGCQCIRFSVPPNPQVVDSPDYVERLPIFASITNDANDERSTSGAAFLTYEGVLCGGDTWQPDPNSPECEPCPECGYCPGGNRVWPLEGCWSASQDTPPVTCRIVGACAGVDPAAPPCARQASESCVPTDDMPCTCLEVATSLCTTEYDGVACTSCSEGFYGDGTGVCFPCGVSTAADRLQQFQVRIIVAFIYLLVISLAIVLLGDRKLGTFVSIIIGIQQFSLIASSSSALLEDMPTAIRLALGRLSLLNLQVEFTRPECASAQPLDWIDFLWYMAALIGAALVMFVVAAYLRKHYLKFEVKHRLEERIFLGVYRAYMRVVEGCCGMRHPSKRRLSPVALRAQPSLKDLHSVKPKLHSRASTASSFEADESAPREGTKAALTGAGGDDEPSLSIIDKVPSDPHTTMYVVENTDVGEPLHYTPSRIHDKIFRYRAVHALCILGSIWYLQPRMAVLWTKNREVLYYTPSRIHDKIFRYRAVHAVCILGSIWYLQISQRALAGIFCIASPGGDDTLVLSVQQNVQCFAGRHTTASVFILAALLCYTVAFPIWTLRKLTAILKSGGVSTFQASEKYGFLYRGLKPRYLLFRWALFPMSLVLAALATFAQYSSVQLFIGCLLFIGNMAFVGIYWPFRNWYNNATYFVLGILAVIQLMLVLDVGGGGSSCRSSSIIGNLANLDGILAVIQLMLVLDVGGEGSSCRGSSIIEDLANLDGFFTRTRECADTIALELLLTVAALLGTSVAVILAVNLRRRLKTGSWRLAPEIIAQPSTKHINNEEFAEIEQCKLSVASARGSGGGMLNRFRASISKASAAKLTKDGSSENSDHKATSTDTALPRGQMTLSISQRRSPSATVSKRSKGSLSVATGTAAGTAAAAASGTATGATRTLEEQIEFMQAAGSEDRDNVAAVTSPSDSDEPTHSAKSSGEMSSTLKKSPFDLTTGKTIVGSPSPAPRTLPRKTNLSTDSRSSLSTTSRKPSTMPRPTNASQVRPTDGSSLSRVNTTASTGSAWGSGAISAVYSRSRERAASTVSRTSSTSTSAYGGGGGLSNVTMPLPRRGGTPPPVPPQRHGTSMPHSVGSLHRSLSSTSMLSTVSSSAWGGGGAAMISPVYTLSREGD